MSGTYDIETVVLVASRRFHINQLHQEMQVGGNALGLAGKILDNSIFENGRVGGPMSFMSVIRGSSFE